MPRSEHRGIIILVKVNPSIAQLATVTLALDNEVEREQKKKEKKDETFVARDPWLVESVNDEISNLFPADELRDRLRAKCDCDTPASHADDRDFVALPAVHRRRTTNPVEKQSSSIPPYNSSYLRLIVLVHNGHTWCTLFRTPEMRKQVLIVAEIEPNRTSNNFLESMSRFEE
ncbi:hypothetical protein KM043_017237 [Ampulex compressa]|nr:hypothetical protein KM043_017237 [Ampulex compressa]